MCLLDEKLVITDCWFTMSHLKILFLQDVWVDSNVTSAERSDNSYHGLWHHQQWWCYWRNPNRSGKSLPIQIPCNLRSSKILLHVSHLFVDSVTWLNSLHLLPSWPLTCELLSSLLEPYLWNFALLLCDRAGVNQWRDCIKPRQILENYCKQNHVSGPHFYGNNSVKVGKKIYNLSELGELWLLMPLIKSRLKWIMIV